MNDPRAQPTAILYGGLSLAFGLITALLMSRQANSIAALAIVGQVLITLTIRLKTGPMLYAWFVFVPQLSARQARWLHVHVATDIDALSYLFFSLVVIGYLLATCKYLTLTTTLVLREYSDEEKRWGTVRVNTDGGEEWRSLLSAALVCVAGAALLSGLALAGVGRERREMIEGFGRGLALIVAALLFCRLLLRRDWRGDTHPSMTEARRLRARQSLMELCWRDTWRFEHAFWKKLMMWRRKADAKANPAAPMKTTNATPDSA